MFVISVGMLGISVVGMFAVFVFEYGFDLFFFWLVFFGGALGFMLVWLGVICWCSV